MFSLLKISLVVVHRKKSLLLFLYSDRPYRLGRKEKEKDERQREVTGSKMIASRL